MSTKKALKEQSSVVEKHTGDKDPVKDTSWTEENQKLLEAGYIMSNTGELYTWKPNTETKIDKTK